MKRTLWCLVIGLLVGAGVQVSWAIDGPLTNALNLRVRTNENGYLLVASGAAGAIDGPLTNFGNIRLRTNENGYLMVTVASGGGGAPTDATYITQTANGDLSAEQALAALATGILRVDTADGVLTSLTDSAGIIANISDETGTGGLVFANTPTLTTPVIGAATGASVVLTGDVSFGGGDLIATADAAVRRSTADASDNGLLSFTGGGGYVSNASRGAILDLFGNEGSTVGSIFMRIGNVATASLYVQGNGGSDWLQILGSDGTVTISNDLIITGIQAGAAGDTDACLDATTNELTDAAASTCIVSSLRFKGGWTPLVQGALAKVLRLEPGSYYNLNDPQRVSQIGLNAENMAVVEPRLTFYEQTGPDIGKPRGVLYEQSVALLTKAIQELTVCVKSANPAQCVVQLEAR